MSLLYANVETPLKYDSLYVLQIRRKADPAKGLVKDWVSKWRDDRTVRGSTSHDQISGIVHQHTTIAHNKRCCLELR